MKTKIGLLTVVLGSILLNACEVIGDSIVPSSTITTETYNTKGFDGIEIANAFTLELRFGETESIEIDANDNLHPYIDVVLRGDQLSIKLKNRVNIRRGDATLIAYVTTPRVRDLEASGASHIRLMDTWVDTDVAIELSGASSIKGDVDVSDLYCELSGASHADISGIADYVELSASGASTFEDYDMNTNWFDVDLSGASDVYVTVNDRLDVEASGASTVNYRGDGQIGRKDLSGASNIRHR